MKRLFDSPRLQDVSRHRNALYGFATLWILLYHMQVLVPAHPLLVPLKWFKDIGLAGVDIFVLLTGMGLYRSLCKNPSLRSFYGRRFARVALPTILVTLLFSGFYGLTLPDMIARMLIFPYWLGVSVQWYSAFILTMYLVYPLIFRIQQKHPKALWGLFAVSVFGAALPSLLNRTSFEALLGVERIPAFLLSCIIAPYLNGDRPIPRWIFPASLAACVLLNVTLHPMQTMDPFPFFTCTLLLAVCMITLLTWLLNLLSIPALHRILNFFGGISLEVYLTFSRLGDVMERLIPSQSIANVCAVPVSILLSCALRRLCEWLIRLPNRRASR